MGSFQAKSGLKTDTTYETKPEQASSAFIGCGRSLLMAPTMIILSLSYFAQYDDLHTHFPFLFLWWTKTPLYVSHVFLTHAPVCEYLVLRCKLAILNVEHFPHIFISPRLFFDFFETEPYHVALTVLEQPIDQAGLKFSCLCLLSSKTKGVHNHAQ